MSIYLCKSCGHLEFNEIPDKCPVCMAAKEEFTQKDNIFVESEEKSKEASVKHIPQVEVINKCGLIPEESCTDILVRIGEVLHPMEEKHPWLSFIGLSKLMEISFIWGSTFAEWF